MKHNKVLHERNVLMNVRTEDVPTLPEAERLEIHHFGQNFHTVTIHSGFLEEPDIPRALALCHIGGLRFNLMDTSFFVRSGEDRRQTTVGHGPALQEALHLAVEPCARRD
jgi:KUP system potassium uptake protein